MKQDVKLTQERMYKEMASHAYYLWLAGKTMTNEQWIVWINSTFNFDYPYVALSGVPQAAHRRATESQKTALQQLFKQKDGSPLIRKRV